ncbi:hypothetical protein FF1_026343 [Malus domestica]|uniref:Uncharacterized protein n=1 Tax=Malus domestica TaxID=3750 RepID=A0A498KF13_MALDO|nr:hypothetical protein DVH24_018009 [Malus domestica]
MIILVVKLKEMMNRWGSTSVLRMKKITKGHEGTQAIFADQDGAKHGNHDEVGEDKEQIPQDKHDEKENERG